MYEEALCKGQTIERLGKWEELSVTTGWLVFRPLPSEPHSSPYTEAPLQTSSGLCAPIVSYPEMQPTYTLHLVCLSMKVNILGVVLVLVFDRNSKFCFNPPQ